MASSSRNQRDSRLVTVDELEKSFSSLDIKSFKLDASGLLLRSGSEPELPGGKKCTKGTAQIASQQGQQCTSGNGLNLSREVADGKSCKLCLRLKERCHCRGRSLSPSLVDSGEGELEGFTSSSASQSSQSLINIVCDYDERNTENKSEEGPGTLQTGLEDFCKYLQSSSSGRSSLSPTNENMGSRHYDYKDSEGLRTGLHELRTYFQSTSGSSSSSWTDEESSENENETDEQNEDEEDPEALRAGFENLSKCIPGLTAVDSQDPYKILCGAIDRIDALSRILNGEEDSSRSPTYEFS